MVARVFFRPHHAQCPAAVPLAPIGGRLPVPAPQPRPLLDCLAAHAHETARPALVDLDAGQSYSWKELEAFVEPGHDLDGCSEAVYHLCRLIDWWMTGEPLTVMTSGTTGTPRPIEWTWERYWREGLKTIEMLELTKDDVMLEYRSLEWNSPRILSVMPWLILGNTLCLAGKFSRSKWAGWVNDNAVSFSAGVPAVLRMLMQGDAVPVPSLKRMSSSSAPLSADEQRAFERRWHVPIWQLYGTTEHGWIAGQRFVPGSAGRPAPGVAVTTIAGEIVADGMPTGDLGHFGDGGYLWLTGRKALIINRGGVKINPSQLEADLVLLGGATEAVVIAAPDPILGEVPEAFVAGGADIAWVVNFTVHKVPELPKNARGKVIRDRATLLKLAERYRERAG